MTLQRTTTHFLSSHQIWAWILADKLCTAQRTQSGAFASLPKWFLEDELHQLCFETWPWDSYLHTLAQHGGYRRPWLWTEAIACLHGVRRMEDSCRLAAESYFERLANLVATKAKTWESVLLRPLQHDLFVRTAPDSWRSPTCACTSLRRMDMRVQAGLQQVSNDYASAECLAKLYAQVISCS